MPRLNRGDYVSPKNTVDGAKGSQIGSVVSMKGNDVEVEWGPNMFSVLKYEELRPVTSIAVCWSENQTAYVGQRRYWW